MRGVLEQIAGTDVTVLIQGESGVGKEIVARAVHETSPRRDRPVRQGQLRGAAGTLLESELFGYEKGAFTGAAARKPGKFELADGGTIFLDEIGEMSPACRRSSCGCSRTRRSPGSAATARSRSTCASWRRPTATSRSWWRSGGFREDLYFRLNVVSIEVPSLRERRERDPPR